MNYKKKKAFYGKNIFLILVNSKKKKNIFVVGLMERNNKLEKDFKSANLMWSKIELRTKFSFKLIERKISNYYVEV